MAACIVEQKKSHFENTMYSIDSSLVIGIIKHQIAMFDPGSA